MSQFIEYLMPVLAILAAIAIGAVCVLGLVVWLGGGDLKAPKQAK